MAARHRCEPTAASLAHGAPAARRVCAPWSGHGCSCGPAGGGRGAARERLRLPSDPDRLYERLYARAWPQRGNLRQLFTLVGDALRDPTATTPRQRAALYLVAARIPGVGLVGRVRDRAGRRGVAVAMRNEPDGSRDTLIFDPATGALLAEERVALRTGYYPAGKTVSYATYASRIVDAIGQRK